jgi:hypothetical protein
VIHDAYDKGFLKVLVLPDNIADLYRLPTPVLNAIRSEIMGTFPVRLVDAPAQIALFAYDNNSFVVESYLPVDTTVSVALNGNIASIIDLTSSQTIAGTVIRGGRGGGRGGGGPNGVRFAITIPPHSFRAFIATAP